MFREAERVRHRLRISRSQLYARALALFLRQERGRWVTRQLDRVYGAAGSDDVDAVWQEACLEVLRRVDWSDY